MFIYEKEKTLVSILVAALLVLSLTPSLVNANEAQMTDNISLEGMVYPSDFINPTFEIVCPISHWTVRAAMHITNVAGGGASQGVLPVGIRINNIYRRSTIGGITFAEVRVGIVANNPNLTGTRGWVIESNLDAIRHSVPCAMSIELGN